MTNGRPADVRGRRKVAILGEKGTGGPHSKPFVTPTARMCQACLLWRGLDDNGGAHLGRIDRGTAMLLARGIAAIAGVLMGGWLVSYAVLTLIPAGSSLAWPLAVLGAAAVLAALGQLRRARRG